MKYQVDDVKISNEDGGTVVLCVGESEKRMSVQDAMLIGQFLVMTAQSIAQRLK